MSGPVDNTDYIKRDGTTCKKDVWLAELSSESPHVGLEQETDDAGLFVQIWARYSGIDHGDAKSFETGVDVSLPEKPTKDQQSFYDKWHHVHQVRKAEADCLSDFNTLVSNMRKEKIIADAISARKV